MIPALQFDNFAPDAAEVRRAVLSGGFTTETGPDGAQYTGISEYQVPHWQERIAQLIQCPIVPKLSCFRLNLAGELPHSWVHSDDICAKYASVLYLNPPEQCEGGTAFWKHAGLGIDRLPSKEELAAKGLDADCFYKLIEREWKVQDAWKSYGMAEMQWNKFITYRTNLFHSRWPWEAFGQGPEDGRLIWVCFYDRAG
jgi:hypothetical protein